MRIFELRCKKIGFKGVKLKYRIHGAATNRAERAACPSTGELELLWAGFADDIGLCFVNEADLKTGLDLLTDILTDFDLHLSEGKTETMILNDERDEDYPENLYTINKFTCGQTTLLQRFHPLPTDIRLSNLDAHM